MFLMGQKYTFDINFLSKRKIIGHTGDKLVVLMYFLIF